MKKKPHALSKDIFRQIWKTKSRFLAIFAIIALGTGFFAGLKSAAPDMLDSVQVYYEEANMPDLHFVSTFGFDENDVQAVADYKDTQILQPGYSVDAFVSLTETRDVIVKTYSIDLDKLAQNETYLNKLVLTEGRLPENENECVVDSGEYLQGAFEIGQEVTLFRNDDTLDDMLKNKTFTVVGFIKTPQYLSYERGSTSLGNGIINNYIYVSEDNFDMEVYTDLWISLKTTENVAFFTEQYKDATEDALDDLAIIADTREEERYWGIYNEAKAELDDALAEWQDGYDKYEDGLADVADGWDAYDNGIVELKNSEKTLDTEQANLNAARSEIDDFTELRNAVGDTVEAFASTYIPAPAPLPDDITELIAVSATFNDILGGGVQFDVLLETYIRTDPADPNKAILQAQLAGMLGGIDTYIAAVITELDNGQDAIDDGRKQIKDGYAELADAKIELQDAEAKLKDAKVELDDGKKEIDDGYAELEDLEKPEWYLFDRNSFPAYSGYEDNAERIDRIASVFPVFFILVAMLVSLTTMTRMVEEQRTEIGTLKALGYKKSQIIAKYLIYASLASLLGSAVGLVAGFRIFPSVVYFAYGMMYMLPDLVAPFRWDYALITAGVALACTGVAAFAAAIKTLHEVPAELMRPKAPKAGKRIFLEKIGFLWNRLSFLQKVTVRNLFRYKNRILMTVIGIAGCTALLLAGFGMRVSVGSIVDKQYTDIFVYDGTMVYDDSVTDEEYADLRNEIDGLTTISEKLQIRISLTDASSQDDMSDTSPCYLFVTEEADKIDNYIGLHTRIEQEPLTLTDDGVVITEKLSKLLELQTGDTFSVEVDENKWVEVTITGISENYVMNYVYFSEAYYESIVGEAPVYNAFVFNMSDTSDEAEDVIAAVAADSDYILTVSFTSNISTDFSDNMDSLDYVILVIILCAGALAFIVLYNLANINVTERVREIATIKVLGFYDKEVSKYINRENTISAMIGTIVGLFLGVPLEKFIIQTAEVDNMMFLPDITPESFIYSVLLTLAFTFIVNFALHHTLRKVDMVESLKSIE